MKITHRSYASRLTFSVQTLLIFIISVTVKTACFAQDQYEQAYGFAFKDNGTFNKVLEDTVGSETIVVGQYNGHGVVAALKPNGETIAWQVYDTLLPKGSTFTGIARSSLTGTVTISGLCKDCQPNRRGQSVVFFRLGTDLKPINVNGKPFSFLAPPQDTTFQAQTTTEMLLFGNDLYIAYEGDSGFGSDIYLSKLDERNFSKIWDKQYNTNFFELPVLLAYDSLNTLGLGLHGWGKTRLLKINTTNGAILNQYAYTDNPGRFTFLGASRYALAYYTGSKLRVSTINARGIETDSTFIPLNFDFTQQFGIATFSDTKIGIAAQFLEPDELPYFHVKTRIHFLNPNSLSTSKTFKDIPTNGGILRNIKKLIAQSPSGELFSIIGDRPYDGNPRPFFFNRTGVTTEATVPTTWYAPNYCSDPILIEKTSSKTFPFTLPYIYNNVQYAIKTNFLNKQEKLWLDIYRPYDHFAKKSTDKRPALIYIHGGGYFAGTEDGGTNFMLQAAQRGMIGVSVKYRLGVHPSFNGNLDSLIYYIPFYEKTVYRALQDVRDAVKFVYDNADAYNIDKTKIFITGHSAGGNAVLNYTYLSQNNFASSLVAELGPLTAKTPIAGVIPYAGPFSTVTFNPPVDPLTYIDGAEKEPIYFIHGTCDSLALFNKGSYSAPNSIYTVGAYALACKKQEFSQPYHLTAIKGGDHGMGTAEPAVFASLFKWIKQKVACGTPDKVCEIMTVVNPQACSNVPLCPSCRANSVIDPSVVMSKIFPNPATATLSVSISIDDKTVHNCEALIFNTFGQLLKKEILVQNIEGVFEKNMDIAALPSGVYLLSFQTNNKLLAEKTFVKNGF